MISLKVRAVGSSAGVIFTKEILKRLQVQEGDQIFLIETPTGYELTPYSEEFSEQMKSAEKGMRLYRNALRELAR
jgi:putative addiction module antidote